MLAERIRAARSVLFVCQGNINRSAVAERALRNSGAAVGDTLRIASAGFDHRGGRQSTALSKSVAEAMSLDIEGHRSSPLTVDMLIEFDLIVVMELSHIARIEEIHREAGRKCMTLAVLDPADPTLDIPDPDGKSRSTFEQVYARVNRCVEVLCRHLSASAHYSGVQAMGRR